MSKKLAAVLTLIAATVVAVPLIARTGNTRSPLPLDHSRIQSSPVAAVPAVPNDNEPQVISLEVTPSGFEPTETIARRGKFLILLHNRTGRRDLHFWLARENEGRVVESSPEKRDWKAHVQLGPGTYIVGETNHPEWKSIIRVTN